MARPCAVCAHRDRHAIDLRLAQTDCNLSALARETKIQRLAMARHRDNHLSRGALLGDLVLRSEAMGAQEIHAQAQALYLKAAETLALIEAGEVVHRDEQGRETRRRSMTSQLKAIRELRATLELMARLVVTNPTTDDGAASERRDLDAAVERAMLGALRRRELERGERASDGDVAEAEIIDESTKADT